MLVAALALGAASDLHAQGLPREPLVFGDGRVTVAGTISATASCAHAPREFGGGCASDTGYFNFTDYQDSLVRLFRIDVSASVNAGRRLAVLTEVRSMNLARPEAYALFLRVRPWPARRFDIQAGRIPPTFGAFARRSYPSDNLLIGLPLPYQYLTSLRADAIPANADELIGMRGRGWLSSFSIGETQPFNGVPLVNGLRFDTGVQVHAATETLDVTGSITAGTLARPLVRDDNAGKQLSGRASWQPLPGLILGTSGARGLFVDRSATAQAGLPSDDRSLTQTAWGTDVEYSRDHYLVRLETVLASWRLPRVRSPFIDTPLRALGTSVEGRYKVRPGLYAAARWDHLGFSRVAGSAATRTWDAPVTRVEAGFGYMLDRNVILKGSYQRNVRDGGRVRALTIGAAQLVFFF